MSLTDEQLLERRQYIGGTDAAALAGVNPPSWAQPIDVYLEKVGLAPPRATSPMMSLGSRLEPVVADMFTERTGIRLRRWSRTVRSKQYPWAGGHLDRWADDGAVFEAKWAMGRDEWGPSVPDGLLEPVEPVRVPARYLVQVQHYLAVTGRDRGYLAVLLGYGDFRWYPILRNEATIRWLMELEELFWREHVVAQVPPEPDGSDGYSRFLRARQPQDDGSEAVATPEQQLLLGQLRDAIRASKAAAREEERLRQLLRDSMPTTARLVAPGATVSYATTKPRLVVEWEALATRLAYLGYAHKAGDPEADPELVRLQAALPADEWPHTKKGTAELVRQVAREVELAHEEPGSRPLKVTFDSDEEEAPGGE